MERRVPQSGGSTRVDGESVRSRHQLREREKRELRHDLFLNLKVDGEKGEGIELAQRFKVVSYPTVVFLDPGGKELLRHVGYEPGPAFVEAMRAALGRLGAEAIVRLAEASPQDATVQLETARFLVQQKQWDAAGARLERARTAESGRPAGFEAELDVVSARLALATQRWADARTALDGVLRAAPEHRAISATVEELAKGLARSGDPQGALELWREVLRRQPDSVLILNGFAWFCASQRLALDEALPIARRAVELSHREPGVLDTLAELHFVRGEHKEALALIGEAIEKAPGDSYYSEQKARFEAGQADAPEPGR